MRLTAATHAATCATCRDKLKLKINTPCLTHFAAAHGMRIAGWRPAVVTAWDAVKTAQQPVDRWAAWRQA